MYLHLGLKKKMTIALYQSEREILMVAARAAPGDLDLNSHPLAST